MHRGSLFSEDEVQKTASIWEGIWSQKKSRRADSGSPIVGVLVERLRRTGKLLFEPDSLSLLVSRIVERELVKEIGQSSVEILEPGCGSGQTSILLAKENASSTLLDISPSALGIARDLFTRVHTRGRFLRASLFEMPLEDDSFDLVWNVGVMEHFREAVQIEGLREMSRVCKRGGLVITAVPSLRGKVYLAAKTFAERRGFWELGYEEPVMTMRDRFSEVEDCCVVREYSVGFLWQFWACRHFLKMIPHARLRRLCQLSFTLAFEMLNRLLLPLNYLPGSWLITVCKKQA